MRFVYSKGETTYLDPSNLVPILTPKARERIKPVCPGRTDLTNRLRLDVDQNKSVLDSGGFRIGVIFPHTNQKIGHGRVYIEVGVSQNLGFYARQKHGKYLSDLALKDTPRATYQESTLHNLLVHLLHPIVVDRSSHP
jgi:hypothetical protein